jgi:2-iminobutanoate/2-iminopropanoate deaminase
MHDDSEISMQKAHAVVESQRVPRRGPYSQAVQVGQLIFVAGQAGLDPATGVVVGATFELQARQAFENLRAILEDAGSGLDHVVKTTCFLAVPEAFDHLNALYAEYFPVAPPARSTPLVQLPRGLLFSIEAIAAAAPGAGTA